MGWIDCISFKKNNSHSEEIINGLQQLRYHQTEVNDLGVDDFWLQN